MRMYEYHSADKHNAFWTQTGTAWTTTHTYFILHSNCLPTKIKPMFEQTVIKKVVPYFILTLKNNKDYILFV
jgi:hypothetical protein